jgi:hypothetical protein
MARFRGTVRGGRGTGSRLGHASTGLHVNANTWNGGVSVDLWVNRDTDEDWVVVWLNAGNGKNITLYRGPVAKYVNPRLKNIELIPLWKKEK